MKFSIITVTYNAEATLERTLQSVAAQTYPQVEHLIIDGASQDRTIEIARSLGYQPLQPIQPNSPISPQRYFLSEPDQGLYDAMNKGLRLATGDYLCFLNAGDQLHSKGTLAHIAQAAEETPRMASPRPLREREQGKGSSVAVLYGDTHIIDNQGNFLRNRRLTPPEHLTWRSFRDGMLVCHQAFYVHRHIALPYDTTYRFSADFDWCIRCLQEGEKQGMTTLYIQEPLADYLSEGMTTANHRASLQERFRIMAKHYGLLTTILQHIWFLLRAITLK